MPITEFIQTYWSYLTIPIVSSLVGFSTNWLAVQMMMHPVEFKGVAGLGWQGVIPANARKMAEIVVTHSLKRVITQQELANRIDTADLIKAINHRINPLVEDLVDEVMKETSHYGLKFSSFFWHAAPLWAKNKVYDEVRLRLPEVAESIIRNVIADIDDLLDINQVVAERLGNNKQLLVDIFQKSAAKEFKFIQRSGFYFGFPLGIPVMFIWHLIPTWWLLPLFGLFTGYATNKLALFMVEKPITPRKVGPLTLHGLFLSRQKEVARLYGQLFANKLVTAATLTREILSKKDNLELIHNKVHKEIGHAIETKQGPLKPLTVISMGPKAYEHLVNIVVEKAFKELIHPDKRSLHYLDTAFDIEATFAERIGNLPPREFYDLLHPVIEEDEWKLIAVGAALGFLAGLWQWTLLA